MQEFPLLVNGQWLPEGSRDALDVINPATEQSVGRMQIATREDLDQVAASSDKAFAEWRQSAPHQRAALLRRAAGRVHQEQPEAQGALEPAAFRLEAHVQLKCAINPENMLVVPCKPFDIAQIHVTQTKAPRAMNRGYQGEVYPLSRWTGQNVKDIRTRLGEPKGLPSVERAHAIAAEIITDRLKELKQQEHQTARDKILAARERRVQLIKKEGETRDQIRQSQHRKLDQLKAIQSSRIRKGVWGLLDRLTGRRQKTLALNEIEKVAITQAQTDERKLHQEQFQKSLQKHLHAVKEASAPHRTAIRELNTDIAWLDRPVELLEPKQQGEKAGRSKHRAHPRDGPDYGR